MRGPRRWLLGLAAISLAVTSLAMAPAVSAQTCGLLTADEVQAAFGVSGVTVTNGSAAYCVFSGPVNLSIGVEMGKTVDQVKAQYAGGSDLTVGGLPAILLPGGTQLYVDLGGRLLGILAYGAAEDADLQAPLTVLAELAIPRVPAGPSAEDMARLDALIPDTLDGQPVTLQTLTGDVLAAFMDPASPEMQALVAALAAQGKTVADILLVGAAQSSDESGSNVAALMVKGADVAALVQPLIQAFSTDTRSAVVSTSEIAGKPVTVFTGEDVVYVYTSGDVAVLVGGSDAFLQEYFGSLP